MKKFLTLSIFLSLLAIPVARAEAATCGPEFVPTPDGCISRTEQRRLDRGLHSGKRAQVHRFRLNPTTRSVQMDQVDHRMRPSRKNTERPTMYSAGRRSQGSFNVYDWTDRKKRAERLQMMRANDRKGAFGTISRTRWTQRTNRNTEFLHNRTGATRIRTWR